MQSGVGKSGAKKANLHVLQKTVILRQFTRKKKIDQFGGGVHFFIWSIFITKLSYLGRVAVFKRIKLIKVFS